MIPTTTVPPNPSVERMRQQALLDLLTAVHGDEPSHACCSDAHGRCRVCGEWLDPLPGGDL